MCVHGGTSDPISRCIIISKCTGNDVIRHRKSRDVLIDQSYVCLRFGAIKPKSLRLSKRQHLADFSWGRNMGFGTRQKALLRRELGRL